MDTWIALLRAVNVGGQHRIAMADLRALCGDLGWRDVQSYIQSGNLVFRAEGDPARLEAALERGLAERFGLVAPVLVRSAAQWREYVETNPFPDAAAREPNRLMLALAKLPPGPDAAERLQERAADGERVARVGDALWIHYPGGVGTSKLTPTLLDRAAGSPVTARNWRTVLQLAELAGNGAAT